MKKTTLFAATALLSVLLVSGLAHAKTEDKVAASAAKSTMEAASEAMPMRGPHKMPKLSEASHKMMQEVMTKMHADNKATFDEMMVKQKEMQDIVKAPTFDKGAYLVKSEEIQTLHHKMSMARAEAMATSMEKMSPEERADLGGMGMGMMGKPAHGKGHGMGQGMGMGAGSMMGDCPMLGEGKGPEGKMAPMGKK